MTTGIQDVVFHFWVRKLFGPSFSSKPQQFSARRLSFGRRDPEHITPEMMQTVQPRNPAWIQLTKLVLNNIAQ